MFLKIGNLLNISTSINEQKNGSKLPKIEKAKIALQQRNYKFNGISSIKMQTLIIVCLIYPALSIWFCLIFKIDFWYSNGNYFNKKKTATIRLKTVIRMDITPYMLFNMKTSTVELIEGLSVAFTTRPREKSTLCSPAKSISKRMFYITDLKLMKIIGIVDLRLVLMLVI